MNERWQSLLFQLPWPPFCCLDQPIPYMVSDERQLGYLLTKNGPLGALAFQAQLQLSFSEFADLAAKIARRNFIIAVFYISAYLFTFAFTPQLVCKPNVFNSIPKQNKCCAQATPHHQPRTPYTARLVRCSAIN